MITLITIAILIYVIHVLHTKLKAASPSYCEELAEDDAKVIAFIEKVRRKATEIKEWLV